MIMHSHEQKCQKGFTLLEVMIALFILTVGLLAAASMQTTSVQQNHVAHRHTAYTTVAQMVMDDLLAVPIIYNPSPIAPNPLALGPNPEWYAVFTTATAAAAPGNWAYIYNRFPPFTGVNPTTRDFYTIPGVGTFRASFSISPNTTLNGTFSQNITRIQVTVFRCRNDIDCNNPANIDPVPFTLTNCRIIPIS